MLRGYFRWFFDSETPWSSEGQFCLMLSPHPPFDARAPTRFWNAPKPGKSAPVQAPRVAEPWSTLVQTFYHDPDAEESTPHRTPEGDHTPAALRQAQDRLLPYAPSQPPTPPPLTLGQVRSPMEVFKNAVLGRRLIQGRFFLCVYGRFLKTLLVKKVVQEPAMILGITHKFCRRPLKRSLVKRKF
jgi:hypothetical protein